MAGVVVDGLGIGAGMNMRASAGIFLRHRFVPFLVLMDRSGGRDD
jgi:hypothetical protein